MPDPIYNEDIRAFIVDRHRMLGSARRHIDNLHDAKEHDKFSVSYTAEMVTAISDHLNVHFSADSALPDLDEWAGANTPQRAYRAAGGDPGLELWDYYDNESLDYVVINPASTNDYFTYPPTITFDHVNGSGATVRPIMGELTHIDMGAEGTGYTTLPTITVSAPDDIDGTTATAACFRGKVTSIAVDTGGSSFTSVPTIVIDMPDGSNTAAHRATATAVLTSDSISAITIDYEGVGYTQTPAVTISGGGGSGAGATATADTSVIRGSYVTLAGSGYSTAPTITLSNEGNGSGATLLAFVNPFMVADIKVLTAGSNYNSYATITVDLTGPPQPDASTTAQDADNGYIPAGWFEEPPELNATTQRQVYRTERTGSLEAWNDWQVPTLFSEYSTT